MTKRTGRLVGRPKKQKPSGPNRARGRPIDFRNDPDRYLLAFIAAHEYFGMSERAASDILSAFTIGNEIPSEVLSEIAEKTNTRRRSANQENEIQALQKIVRNCPSGMVVGGWWAGVIDPDPTKDGVYVNTRPGSNAQTIHGHAGSLRQKARRWRKDEEASFWLHAMTAAFAATLSTRLDIADAKLGTLRCAALADETHFAIDVILPMIELAYGQKHCRPDF